MLHFSRWKLLAIWGICLLGSLLAVPNLLPTALLDRAPDWLPHRTITLGLDLQGGSHLLLEVGVETMVRERLDSLVDDVRQTLRKGQVGYTGLRVRNNTVTVQIRNPGDVNSAVESLRKLARPVGGGMLSGATQDIEVSVDPNGLITVALSPEATEARKQSAVVQSLEIVRRRIDQLGMREPTIQREGADRILVQLPGVTDPERVKELLGKTARLSFQLVDVSVSPEDAQSGRIPAGDEILEGTQPGETYVVQKRIIITGENLVDAQAAFDSRTSEPIVNFRFDSTGAKRFGDVTRENINRPFAIVLDNKVISAPVIREPILGGSGQISGRFTVQGANDLAVLLRAGALPAPLTVLEERTVGPDLGADSIRMGKIAALVGSAAVLIYMILAYGLFGIFANIALLIDIALLFGVLSFLGATLTLPGIAGIVLTIGTAVDANVLIFERMREEARAGKTVLASMEAGYKRAWAVILDANVTTLISALIMFELGSGPIRGFAVTLAVGVVTSVFTGFTVSRVLTVMWMRMFRPRKLPI